MTETSMVERVARAIESVPVMSGTYSMCGDDAIMLARAAIEAIPDDDETFLAALSRRAHDARFGRSGETYPVFFFEESPNSRL